MLEEIILILKAKGSASSEQLRKSITTSHHGKLIYDDVKNILINCENLSKTLEGQTYGTAYQIFKKILETIDPDITMPLSNKYSNLKKKLLRNRNDSQSIVKELYPENESSPVVGTLSQKIGLTPKVFDEIINNKWQKEDIKNIQTDTISNLLAFEVLNYASNYYQITECNKIFSLMLGRVIAMTKSSIYNNFEKLKKNKMTIQSKHSSHRVTLKEEFWGQQFVFPKSANEIYDDNLLNEKISCIKVIENLRARYQKLKADWLLCEQRNNQMNILLETQYLNEEKSDEEKLKLKNENIKIRRDFIKISNDLRSLKQERCLFSIREVNRREKRRNNLLIETRKKNSELANELKVLFEDKIAIEEIVSEQGEKIKELELRLYDSIEEKRKCQKSRNYYMKQASKSATKNQKMMSHEIKIKDLEEQVIHLQNEKLEIEDQLESMLNNELSELKNRDGSYTNNIRAMFQDLVLCGVGIKETRNVIATVARNMFQIEVDVKQLPSESFARGMYEEARLLALAQVGSELKHAKDTTLQTDGTTKRGHHYGTMDINTESGRLVAGLRPMACGDAESTMDILKEVMTEIEKICNDSRNDMSKKIIMGIKNTMSDRHIVQKKFNHLLEEYRTDICKQMEKDWDNLTTEEQKKMTKINDFYCGLHFVVGMADHTEACLKSFEHLIHGENKVGSLAHGGYSNGESGTLRLIRTLCKAVEEHGCEKSGRMREFEDHLKEGGFKKNPLAHFKGNRFIIIFLNGGIAYSIHDQCIKFFDSYKDENRLLKAVYYDLMEPTYVIGCRALGLINKYITGPLWRLMVKEKHVLDMNKHYVYLEKKCKELSTDASNFIKGNEIFFGDEELIHKDEIFEKLMISNDHDETLKQLLELIFANFSIVTRRMLYDHLNGGKYDDPNEDLITQSATVPNTNTNPETDFGFLDRLKIMKPNSNDITFEAIIMCRTNKMSAWRDKLDDTVFHKLMTWVKKSKKEHYRMFIERRTKIQQARNQRRIETVEGKRKKEISAAHERAELTKKVQEMGGLCEKIEQIDSKLKCMNKEKFKIEFLKSQLKFRQKVLGQTFVDSDLYVFSRNKIPRSSTELSCNLKSVISKVAEAKDEMDENVPCVPNDLILSKEVMAKEKSRLEMLLTQENVKINKKRLVTEMVENQATAPPRKRQRINSSKNERCLTNNASSSESIIPQVDSPDELIGKRVAHFTAEGNTKGKWYEGVVVCRKPNSETELVIKYDGEDPFYSFDYSEFVEHELVQLLEIEPEWAVGRLISQRFETEDGTSSWWEMGRVLSYKDGIYTVEYYDNENNQAEEDNYIPCDTLNIELDKDYCTHDLRFHQK